MYAPTRRSLPARTRSSTSVSGQYHRQENQRRSSRSGATTAARTAATARSATARWGSAGPGPAAAPAPPGLIWSHRASSLVCWCPLARGDLNRAGDDGAASLQRCPQRGQLLPLQPQLHPQVVEDGRAHGGEMVEQLAPARVLGAHPLDLGPADGVEQVRGFAGHQQVLAPVHGTDDVAPPGELAKPGPLGRGPAREAATARLVRLFVAGLVQARQRAVGGAGQQAALAQELLGPVDRLERPAGSQPAPELPPFQQLRQRLHSVMIPRRRPSYPRQAPPARATGSAAPATVGGGLTGRTGSPHPPGRGQACARPARVPAGAPGSARAAGPA